MKTRPKALFDVSVLVDALTNGNEPSPESLTALTLAADGRIDGYLCAGAIDCLNDLLTRAHGAPTAMTKLRELRSMLDIAHVDETIVDAAMALGWQYLDDALAHECARLNGIDRLITLNPQDFSAGRVAVQAPNDLVREITASAA